MDFEHISIIGHYCQFFIIVTLGSEYFYTLYSFKLCLKGIITFMAIFIPRLLSERVVSLFSALMIYECASLTSSLNVVAVI